MLSSGDKIGSYTIREQAGAGGMATVYKAWHEGLHRFEALKVPRGAGDAAADSAYVLRLLTEARVAAQLHHPNIVAIHNISEVDAVVPFFAMDWVEGEDLAQILKFKKQFSLHETIEILEPVALALDYAHSKGVVHRDVKPANILLENKNGNWVPHVVDFGISRAAEDEDGATKLTKSGMLVGTPEYMSPEQAGSGDLVDNRTDIYSLAIVAYEMVCGAPPFTAGSGVSRLSILIGHVSKPIPLYQVRPDFPREVGDVLLRGLAKSPDDRSQSCSSFIAELKAVAAKIPVGGLLPSMQADDGRTPFDATRFDIDDEATLIQRGGLPPVQAKTPSIKETSVATVPAIVAQSVAEEDEKSAPTQEEPKSRDTLPSHTEKPSQTKILPADEPVQKKVIKQDKKSAGQKIGLWAGGAVVLVLGVAALASISMQRLNLAPTVTETPTPKAEITISQPTPVIEKQPTSNIRTIRVTRMRSVPFETETRRSRRRAAGQTAVIQQGRAGTREVVLSIKMDGEKEVSRDKVSERDVLQPVTQIVEVGTRQRTVVRRTRVRNDNGSPRQSSGTKPVTPVNKPAIKPVVRRPVRDAPLPP